LYGFIFFRSITLHLIPLHLVAQRCAVYSAVCIQRVVEHDIVNITSDTHCNPVANNTE